MVLLRRLAALSLQETERGADLTERECEGSPSSHFQRPDVMEHGAFRDSRVPEPKLIKCQVGTG